VVKEVWSLPTAVLGPPLALPGLEGQYSNRQHNYTLAVINIFSTGKMVGVISASNFKVSFKIVYLPKY
jgi:Na+/H+ antiporter NhaA